MGKAKLEQWLRDVNKSWEPFFKPEPRTEGIELAEDNARVELLSPADASLRILTVRKYKRFKAHKIRASRFLQRLVRDNAGLFVHWRIGMIGTLPDGSRVS